MSLVGFEPITVIPVLVRSKRVYTLGSGITVIGLMYTVTRKGLAWLIIMGSGFGDFIYWHFFTITVDYNSSHIELLLNDVCLANLSEEFLASLGLIPTPWIRESTAFYNFHVARIEITSSKVSITVLHECVISETMS
jgi:hypothetical protein